MLRPSSSVRVFLYNQPMDMRKSIDGLALIVEQQLEQRPFDGDMFVFCNRQRDKIKLLYWERNGFVLWYKRLEKERFRLPAPNAGVITLDGRQLNALLDGFDIFHQPPHQSLFPESMS
jgi:transposase